jgi:hypothetical protein
MPPRRPYSRAGFLSVIGIASGFVVLYGLLTASRMDGWTLVFLVTTSVSGFFFPFKGVSPAIILGILSLVVLAAAIPARCAFHLADLWRWIYVVSSVVALYFNLFVLVVQAFLKIPLLALAPEGSEPPSPSHRGSCWSSYLGGNPLREMVLPRRRRRKDSRSLGVSLRRSQR